MKERTYPVVILFLVARVCPVNFPAHNCNVAQLRKLELACTHNEHQSYPSLLTFVATILHSIRRRNAQTRSISLTSCWSTVTGYVLSVKQLVKHCLRLTAGEHAKHWYIMQSPVCRISNGSFKTQRNSIVLTLQYEKPHQHFSQICVMRRAMNNFGFSAAVRVSYLNPGLCQLKVDFKQYSSGQ